MAIGRRRSPCGAWCGATSDVARRSSRRAKRGSSRMCDLCIRSAARGDGYPAKQVRLLPRGDAMVRGARYRNHSRRKRRDRARLRFAPRSANRDQSHRARSGGTLVRHPAPHVDSHRKIGMDVQTPGRQYRFHAASDARGSTRVHRTSALTATTKRALPPMSRAGCMARPSTNIAAPHHPLVALRDNDGNVFFANRLLRCGKKKYQLQQSDRRMTDCYEYVCRFALHRLTRD